MWLLLLAAFASAEPQWVDADVLNVRDAPGGDIVARLVSNDQVDVTERNGPHAHVRHQWGEGWVEGWVDSTFLAERRIPNYDTLRSGSAPKADRLRAADRLLVEYGYSPTDRAQFEERLRQTGDFDKAAMVAAPSSVYVAVCDGTDLIVAGKIPPAGPFESWANADRLQARLSEVATQRWYTEHSNEAPRFPGARLDAQAMVLRGEGIEDILVLGPCHETGALYLSRHDVGLQSTPQPAAVLFSHAEESLVGLGQVTDLQMRKVAGVVHIQATSAVTCGEGPSDYSPTCEPTYFQRFVLGNGTEVAPTLSTQIEHTAWVTAGDGSLGPIVLGTNAETLMVLYPAANPVVEYRIDVSFAGC
ncbi:MAG: hypothetical protein ACJAZO_005322 [Myxococcota bacterium]|jgi:hypothetical protein